MKDWEPPLPVDKWYAHIWRSLLRKNSRKRAGMTKKVVEIVEDDDEFNWRYAILEKKHGGETYYHVCEEYPGMGYTDAETPMGDNPEELQHMLEMMLEDVKGAIAHKNIIVDGAPYDNWRIAELEKGETVPWDDVKDDLFGDLDDIENDPTVRMKVDEDE